MKTLTLSIKQVYFDQILAGTKTHEYRDIYPHNEKRYIYFELNGKIYLDADLLPTEEEEPGELHIIPIKYDRLKLLTGAYSGKRPYIIVEVLDAQIKYILDENGERIMVIEEESGLEFVAAQMDYTLGKIIERSGC